MRALLRTQCVAFALALCALGVGTEASSGPKGERSKSGALKREPKRRALTITDASVDSIARLYVAGGTPTTLVFRGPVNENGVLLADVKGQFYPPQVVDKSVILVPKVDLSGHELTALTVTLSDGTVLPFQLVTAADVVDLQVDVEVALEARAAPESPAALKASIAQLQGRLDECAASAGSAGLSKVAALIAAQDLDKPQAFTVERRSLRHLDKQSRLLVEAKHLYRLFGLSYLVLTVENRDPSRPWVLDRPELATTGGEQAADVSVLTFTAELGSLPPDEVEKVVVVFATPQMGVGQQYSLTLLEKNGGRHVKLEGLKL